jgi:hypothetical protein
MLLFMKEERKEKKNEKRQSVLSWDSGAAMHL